MVDDLPSAGSRGGRQVGTMVFLTAIILVAVVVIAEILALAAETKARAPLPIVPQISPLRREADRSGSRITSAKPPAANAIPVNPPCRDGQGTTERSGSPSEAPSSRG